MLNLSPESRFRHSLSLQQSFVDRFLNIPFSELCEIYTELSNNSYTPQFFDVVTEIFNERNEFNNFQLLIEG